MALAHVCGRLTGAALLLAPLMALGSSPGAQAPAGLTPGDWSELRRQVEESSYLAGRQSHRGGLHEPGRSQPERYGLDHRRSPLERSL